MGKGERHGPIQTHRNRTAIPGHTARHSGDDETDDELHRTSPDRRFSKGPMGQDQGREERVALRDGYGPWG
jgi:hypothetical protein